MLTTLAETVGPDRRWINTHRRSHEPFDGFGPLGSTYSACIWDHEAEDWELRVSGVSLMGLRAVIRELEAEGWSAMSYLIVRDWRPNGAGVDRA